MKKIAFMMCLAIFTMGCESDDDSNDDTEQVNPDDLDGDGVTNQQETVDNTNPNDPCSFVLNSQYYPSISNTWKDLDCDGDGVTNWKELDPDGNNLVEGNGTSPLQECDFILEDQTVTPLQSWLDRDCDGDGVTNEQEVIDGTDIFDLCDFIYGNQNVEPWVGWFTFDCDEDGITNGTEYEDGTNPLDPTEFNGSGNILREIRAYDKKHIYNNNGANFDKTTAIVNDYVFINHEYNTEGKLTHVFIDDDPGDINIYFTYTNNKISQVTRIEPFEEDYIYDVIHEDNIIYTYDGTEPDGLYTKKFTFDSQDHLISVESFEAFGSTFYKSVQIFNYDPTFEKLLSFRTETIEGYNDETDEFYSLYPNNYLIRESTFSYNEDVLNPLYESSQNIRLNIILGFGKIISSEVSTGNIFGSHSLFSEKLMTGYVYTFENSTNVSTFGLGWTPVYVQENGLPTRIRRDYGVGDFDVHDLLYE